MYRVGIVTQKGRIEAKTFSSREEVDTYILDMDEKEKVTRYRIECDGLVIETEQGKKA